MNIRILLVVLLMALTSVGAQAQSRKRRPARKPRVAQKDRPRVPDDFKGTGASIYDLDADLPEDSSAQKGGVVTKVDTVRSAAAAQETLIPTAEIDENYVLQATASSPLDKVEVCDASGKVLRSQGLHRGTKASIDLNQFPKDQTLVFKFYGVNGSTQNIELSH